MLIRWQNRHILLHTLNMKPVPYPCPINCDNISALHILIVSGQSQRLMSGSSLLAHKYRSDAREWTYFRVMRQHRGWAGVSNPKCCDEWSTQMHSLPYCGITYNSVMLRNARWSHLRFLAYKKDLLIFLQSKWVSLPYSVSCDSQALLTHPETCWM